MVQIPALFGIIDILVCIFQYNF